MRPYKTLGQRASDEYIVQKSRFIGIAAPVETEEAALEMLAGVRGAYRDASHHCYAYIIGRNAGIMRYQDDGEPSGTAGQPILEVLRMKELVNVCLVVVRYFGGVLLGAGGLTRAYSKTAALAANAAGTVSMEPSLELMADIPYPYWDRIAHRLTGLPVMTLGTEYGSSVVLNIALRQDDQQMITDALMSLSDGKADMIEVARDYRAWPEADSA